MGFGGGASGLECPAAVCIIYASAFKNVDVSVSPSSVSAPRLEQVAEMMDLCYEEIAGDVNQVILLGGLGFNFGLLELARAQVTAWLRKVKPRNPHHDEGRVVWRDHYSGIYPKVNYAEQFDMQWRLALESPDSDFGRESSVRLDDCALNDMIESTFGEREYLKGCNSTERAAHEEKERGIVKRNTVLLDVDRVNGSAALDVGCGFGRWTAMLTALGAQVTSVDASPHAVQSTRRYNPDRTYQMSLFDLPTLPGFDNGFDLVICWGVMQHTHDPLQAFNTVASAVREGGVLFIQVYNDHSKAAYPFTNRLREHFHKLQTTEEQVRFLKRTASAAGADPFDHLDGMLTFYNWVVHEETVRQWYFDHGFTDYWRVWNYKYLGMRRSLERPVRDDAGELLTNDVGEAQSGIAYYPIHQDTLVTR